MALRKTNKVGLRAYVARVYHPSRVLRPSTQKTDHLKIVGDLLAERSGWEFSALQAWLLNELDTRSNTQGYIVDATSDEVIGQYRRCTTLE